MIKDKTKTVDTDEIEEDVETSLDENEERIIALEQKVEEAENKYKRAIADYQNLQKRSIEDRQEWIRSANKDLLLRILTVFDTLILAYQHLKDKNLQVSIDHFLDILKSEGVQKIETDKKDFDPLVMEAISTAEGEEGKVIAEVRAGFLLHEKLLRAAQVIVGSGEQN